MCSTYRTTDQGQQTRSQLLAILQERNGLSRQELVALGLTYDQVRRQTKNLSMEGIIVSQRDGRQWRYFIKSSSLVGTLCIVLIGSWSVPV